MPHDYFSCTQIRVELGTPSAEFHLNQLVPRLAHMLPSYEQFCDDAMYLRNVIEIFRI